MKKITIEQTKEKYDSCNLCHINNYHDKANINSLSFTSENNQSNVVKICDSCLKELHIMLIERNRRNSAT